MNVGIGWLGDRKHVLALPRWEGVNGGKRKCLAWLIQKDRITSRGNRDRIGAGGARSWNDVLDVALNYLCVKGVVGLLVRFLILSLEST
jgi:hypothetical protein